LIKLFFFEQYVVATVFDPVCILFISIVFSFFIEREIFPLFFINKAF